MRPTVSVLSVLALFNTAHKPERPVFLSDAHHEMTTCKKRQLTRNESVAPLLYFVYNLRHETDH